MFVVFFEDGFLRTSFFFFSFLYLLCSADSSFAKVSGAAYSLKDKPVLDGRILEESVWKIAKPMTNFMQVKPVEGAPASQRTEVFVGYTSDNLYVGVICYDENPDSIISASNKRDSDLDEEDSFRFVIDTFQSEQDGFVFGTNPSGVEFDGQIATTEMSRFGSRGFNTNWDTTWRVVSRVHDKGWSAEFEIPFKSLRYRSDETQEWNINFQRNIRRTNEVAFWSPLPVQHGLNRLSLAGALKGVRVPRQRNLSFTPYLLGKSDSGGPFTKRVNTEEAGFDLKYSITPSLTMDATYNTDFAQVEVDQQQVNLDRFSLFFPETRPFFLENAGLFSVGDPREIDLFFSRRIGIGAGGDQLPIAGGLRVSGRLGDATNIGFLQMRSEEVLDLAPEMDFTVVRLNQEMDNRSSLGMLVVNKEAGIDDNQTYAVDGVWGIGENVTLKGFVAKTQTEGISRHDHAMRFSGAFDGQVWSYNAKYAEVGGGFNPEVGFLSRKNYRQISVYGGRRVRLKESDKLLELRPHANYAGYWNFDGIYESGRIHVDSVIIWKNGASLSKAINFTHETVIDAFNIVDGISITPGEYDHEELTIYASSDKSAPLNFGLQFVAGGFFGGDRITFAPKLEYRVGDQFKASFSINHNNIEVPGGAFNLNLSQLKLSYSFTPKISVQAFFQHNDRDDVISTNVRFSWLRSANSGLFLVYNETDNEALYPGRERKEVILKFSHIFRLLN